MATETVLTDEQIMACLVRLYEKHKTYGIGELYVKSDLVPIGRAIEQAVMQSPEVQAWKRDAERNVAPVSVSGGDADHDLHLAWCNVALGLATDYAEAYCNMQCDDSEDRLHEMLRARRELQQHLYNQPASMGPPGDPEDEKENPHD